MRAEVLSNIEVAPSYFHLILSCPEFPSSFEPGQFVMLRLGKGFDPFLPRPFSIYRSSRRKSAISHQPSAKDWRGLDVEIIYKVVGKATGLMAGMGPGAKLDILGPLGKGFKVPANLETAILVAGGIGVPPLVALAESLGVRGKKETHRFNGGSFNREAPEPLASARGREAPEPLASARGKQTRLIAFLGGKTKEDVLCIKDFERLGVEIHISTEDGSLGFKGLITDLLNEFLLTTGHWRLATVYACGPHPMLAEVAAIASKHKIPCQVSLETMMACGIGACMGCAVSVHSSQEKPTVLTVGDSRAKAPSPSLQRGDAKAPSPSLQRGDAKAPSPSLQRGEGNLVCKDGPVFDAGEIEW